MYLVMSHVDGMGRESVEDKNVYCLCLTHDVKIKTRMLNQMTWPEAVIKIIKNDADPTCNTGHSSVHTNIIFEVEICT